MVSKKSTPISLRIMQRIQQGPGSAVWTLGDFFDLGNREAIKKALQRMVATNHLRRIDRGLYDLPRINPLTGKPTVPDYRRVIDAVSRRDQARVLVDGLTAANDLGLTNAVPAKVTVHTDARIRPISLDKLVLQFKLTAPSKLYWAGRPAMQIIQSLYWLRDTLNKGTLIDEPTIRIKILQLLKTPIQGPIILDDLAQNISVMPAWMQDWIRSLLLQMKTVVGKDKNE